MSNYRQEIPPGHVSELPTHHGDGYPYGGDVLVTFGSTTINLGPNERKLARTIAAAPDLLSALGSITGEAGFEGLPETKQKKIEAALAKARGKDAG